jgi:hypothetical protein
VKVRSLVLFGAGYVLGSRAGRERYAQIAKLAGSAAERLRESEFAANAAEPTVRLADYLQGATSNGTRRPS